MEVPELFSSNPGRGIGSRRFLHVTDVKDNMDGVQKPVPSPAHHAP